MTSFGHVLVVIYVLLLCSSFAVTGEAIMTAKLSKRLLGDYSINRGMTNTERMTNENDAADFWKRPKSFCSDLLTAKDGAPRLVSRPAGYPRSIYQPIWSPSFIRHVIKWPHERGIHRVV